MYLGVFDPIFSHLSLDEMLDKVQQAGLSCVEIGAGGNPGSHHFPYQQLLESEDKRKAYLKKFADRNLFISALSCHNNPLSPNEVEQNEADLTLRRTIKLASLLGVPVVNTFSGTPGTPDQSKYPFWPVITWPNHYREIYEWQWKEKVIPYWKEIGKFAEAHNVKIAIELHGGFSCHTPYTLLKLRNQTSKNIGVNFDPSHLWWQGIDPVAAIKILGKEGAIFHFHAKDTYLDQDNINMYGLTDMQSFGELETRAWMFRTVGHGHSMKEWAEMLDTLRLYGYDYAISIEHEDSLMTIDEGFNKAIDNLNTVISKEKLKTDGEYNV